MPTPVIPETITVHLGRPNEAAANVTLPFADYIKNVASSEIYPTWPENALRANIYAQISFALNRVYTEYYRSRGYDFDITNSTAFDQYFVNGRDIFENVGQIVDEIFNSYVARGDGIEPYFTQYCNGTTVTCDGLSQTGTVALANDGLLPYQILQYYYGDDIRIVEDVPVENVRQSYPGEPLRLGATNNDVLDVQLRLNRISQNYPSIPKIYPTDGTFAIETEEAVKAFQRIFNLTPDGVVGNATWYQIARIFNAVKRLNELNSEGLKFSEIGTQFEESFTIGARGDGVRALQYALAYISTYVNEVPPVPITGYFGEQTRNAVLAFQRVYGLTQDGIVGPATWNAIYNVYRGIIDSLPDSAFENTAPPFPGTFLVRGSEGEDVRALQEALVTISEVRPEVPSVRVTGYFGTQTNAAVVAVQELYGIEPNGVVGPITWDAIMEATSDIRGGYSQSAGQYPANI